MHFLARSNVPRFSSKKESVIILKKKRFMFLMKLGITDIAPCVNYPEGHFGWQK